MVIGLLPAGRAWSNARPRPAILPGGRGAGGPGDRRREQPARPEVTLVEGHQPIDTLTGDRVPPLPATAGAARLRSGSCAHLVTEGADDRHGILSGLERPEVPTVEQVDGAAPR